MTQRNSAAVVLLAMVLPSCSGDEATRQPLAVEDGVPALRITEEARVDGVAANLVSIGGAVLFDDGAIAISQPQDHVVRIYDRNGHYLMSSGRRGAGPGEFAQISNMGLHADGLWVWDAAQARMSIISTDGEFQGTVRLPAGRVTAADDSHSELGMLFPLAVTPDGALVGRSFSRNAILLVAPGTDRMRVLTSVRDISEIRRIVLADGTQLPGELFSATPLFAASPRGNFFAMVRPNNAEVPRTDWPGGASAEVSVTRFDSSGDTTYHRIIVVGASEIQSCQLVSVEAGEGGRRPALSS